MNKSYFAPLVAFSLLVLWGCSGDSAQQSQSPTPSPNSPAAQATPPAAPPPSPPPAASNSTSPPPKTKIAASGLIPPTNAGQRLKDIDRSRTNPFALMDVPVIDPQATAPNQAGESSAPGQKGSGNSSSPGKNGQGGKTTPVSTKSARLPVGQYCKWDGKSRGTILEIQPVEAQGVFVSGIIQLPTALYALITPRNSKVSQYVRQGAVLGNGVVKVASIDPVNQTVIFEENGKYVYREIGQMPEPAKAINLELDWKNFPFKVQPPKGPDAFGWIRKGNKALMLTQASILVVNVAGESKPDTLQQLTNSPWPRRPQNPTDGPVAVPVPAPTNAGGGSPPEANPQPTPTPPQNSAPPATTSNPQTIENSIRLSGTICNDSASRMSVSQIKVQIQDAETGVVIDTFWGDVASTAVVLTRGQKAEFDVLIPGLRNRSSETVTVKLLDWQGE